MRAVALPVALCVVLVGDASAGPCGGNPATSITLSARDIELPSDGGVVVGTSTIGLGGAGGAADAMNPSWRFRTTDSELTPTLVALAPGLVSYRPPADATGELTLAAGNIALLTVKRSGVEEKPLAAPVVTRVRRTAAAGTRMRAGQVTVTADLRAKPPASALALVMLAVAKDGTTTARAWTTVSTDAKSFVVYQSPNRCEPPIPGAAEAAVGEKVVFAFVDVKGRLSKLSKPIAVRR